MDKSYLCSRCGYTSNNMLHVTRHLKRKKVCSPILSDIERCDLLLEFQSDRVNPKKYPCTNNCGKAFTKKSSVVRHMQKCDTISHKYVESLKDEIACLKQAIEQKEISPSTQINNTNKSINKTINNSINKSINNTNNSLSNTINNNITIKVFGQEDKSYTDHPDFYKFFISVLKDHKHGLARYIEYKYFNSNFPQNQTIKKHDDPDKLNIYESNGWQETNRPDVINMLIDEIESDFYNVIRFRIESEEIQGRVFGDEEQAIVKCLVEDFMKYVGYILHWDNDFGWFRVSRYVPEPDLEVEDLLELNIKNSIHDTLKRCIDSGHRVMIDHRIAQ
jgi:hypothetical protein